LRAEQKTAKQGNWYLLETVQCHLGKKNKKFVIEWKLAYATEWHAVIH